MEKTQQERLKEVIHLYLGCEVEVTTSSATFKGKLVGLFFDQWKMPNGPMELTFQVCIDDHIYHLYKAKICKLILRSLDDMTEEEAIELYNHIFPDVPRDDRFKANIIKSQIDKNGFYYEGRVSMQDFTEWFRWCLGKHFDLFNLIPDGIAINAKELHSLKPEFKP